MMKKKIIGFVAIIALSVVNFKVIEPTNNEGLVDLLSVCQNAFANQENGEHENNTGWTIITQGATKDEREVKRQCPTEQSSSGSGNVSGSYGGANVSIGGNGSSSQSNSSSRYDIACGYGYSNCTSVDC